MKIYIGPYKNWFGPYQLANLLKKVGASEETCHKIGEWLAGDSDLDYEKNPFKRKERENFLVRFLTWVYSKRKRKVKIKIHKYDTWGMDSTLAMIILPMLKQLKETKHGSPLVDDADVPEHLRSTSAPPKENEWDTDDNHHHRWDWVMDQMIWSFEQLQPDYDWEAQYHSGNYDIYFQKIEGGLSEMRRGPNDTHKFDAEGHRKHSDQIQNGLILFGKYYRGLWD